MNVMKLSVVMVVLMIASGLHQAASASEGPLWADGVGLSVRSVPAGRGEEPNTILELASFLARPAMQADIQTLGMSMLMAKMSEFNLTTAIAVAGPANCCSCKLSQPHCCNFCEPVPFPCDVQRAVCIAGGSACSGACTAATAGVCIPACQIAQGLCISRVCPHG